MLHRVSRSGVVVCKGAQKAVERPKQGVERGGGGGGESILSPYTIEQYRYNSIEKTNFSVSIAVKGLPLKGYNPYKALI